MRKPRGNKTSKVAREERKAQALKILNEGGTQKDAQEVLGVSRTTLHRYLKSMDLEYQERNPAAYAELKTKVLEAVAGKMDELEAGTLDAEDANAWRGLVSEFSKIAGLHAPTKTITARVDAEQSPLFLKFKKSVAGLDDQQVEEAFAYLRSIPRRAPATVIDASWLPAERKALDE